MKVNPQVLKHTLGRKLPGMDVGRALGLLVLGALIGAVGHEWFAGQRMWAYHQEEAAEQVAEAEANAQPAAQFSAMWNPPTDAEVRLAKAETQAAHERQARMGTRFGPQVENSCQGPMPNQPTQRMRHGQPR